MVTQLVLGLFTTIPMFPVTLAGIAAHGAYYTLIRTFPFFDLLSPQFIGSAGRFEGPQCISCAQQGAALKLTPLRPVLLDTQY